MTAKIKYQRRSQNQGNQWHVLPIHKKHTHYKQRNSKKCREIKFFFLVFKLLILSLFEIKTFLENQIKTYFL